MKIRINNTEYEAAAGATVADVLAAHGLDGPGIAVALKSKVIRRAERGTTVLADGDELTVIKAVCGG